MSEKYLENSNKILWQDKVVRGLKTNRNMHSRVEGIQHNKHESLGIIIHGSANLSKTVVMLVTKLLSSFHVL